VLEACHQVTSSVSSSSPISSARKLRKRSGLWLNQGKVGEASGCLGAEQVGIPGSLLRAVPQVGGSGKRGNKQERKNKGTAGSTEGRRNEIK
jgi:hypothetical protein